MTKRLCHVPANVRAHRGGVARFRKQDDMAEKRPAATASGIRCRLSGVLSLQKNPTKIRVFPFRNPVCESGQFLKLTNLSVSHRLSTASRRGSTNKVLDCHRTNQGSFRGITRGNDVLESV